MIKFDAITFFSLTSFIQYVHCSSVGQIKVESERGLIDGKRLIFATNTESIPYSWFWIFQTPSKFSVPLVREMSQAIAPPGRSQAYQAKPTIAHINKLIITSYSFGKGQCIW